MHKYARALTHPQAHCQRCTGGASCELRAPHQKDTSDFSDGSQMMMHRDLLSLQRQNKRTNMKEKSINIRRLIKRWISCWIHYKGFGFSFLFLLLHKWQNKMKGNSWVRGLTQWWRNNMGCLSRNGLTWLYSQHVRASEGIHAPWQYI